MINDPSPDKMRHEIKHSINTVEDYLLAMRLRKLFSHDKNAGSRGIYRVSSLYFDTPEDKALRQKIDGVNRREKFRLRYYNQNLSYLMLEKKIKVNGLCAKRSVALTIDQTKRILEGDIGFMLESKNPLLVELYSKMRGQLLRPKTVVCYEREAFVYQPGNVRITIDRNLRSGLYSTDFLNTDLNYTNVSDALAVLEVKFDEFLPDIVKMAVQVPDCRANAFSKYAVCRRYD